MPAIPTPVVGGIRIPRHPLDAAARALLRTARELVQQACHSPPADEEAAKCASARAKLAEAATRIVLGLMIEQRERAKMAAQQPPITDEEYAAEMSRRVATHMREMSDDDFGRFVDERMARVGQ